MGFSERRFSAGSRVLGITTMRLPDTPEPVDAIVSSDDNYFSHGGGVSAAIWEHADSDWSETLSSGERAKLGDVVPTSAQRLGLAAVLHAVVIDHDQNRAITWLEARETFDRIHVVSSELELRGVATPLIATGVGRVPVADVAKALALAAEDWLAVPSNLTTLWVSVPEPDDFWLVCSLVEPVFKAPLLFDGLRARARKLLANQALSRHHPHLDLLVNQSDSPEVGVAAAALFDEVAQSGSRRGGEGHSTGRGSPGLSEFVAIRNHIVHGLRRGRWDRDVTRLLAYAVDRLEELARDQPLNPGQQAPPWQRRVLRRQTDSSDDSWLEMTLSPPVDSRHQSRRPVQPVLPSAGWEDVRSRIVAAHRTGGQHADAISGTEHVRRLQQLILRHADDATRSHLASALAAEGYAGPFELQLLEYCTRAANPVALLRQDFNWAQLNRMVRDEQGVTPEAGTSADHLAETLLRSVGFSIPSRSIGLPEVAHQVDRHKNLVLLEPNSAQESVQAVGRLLEYLLQVLIHFISQAAFGKAGEAVLKDARQLQPGQTVTRSGLGQLSIYADWLIGHLEESEEPRAQVFRRDMATTESLRLARHGLAEVRNTFAHFRPGVDPGAAEAKRFLNEATQFVQQLSLRQPPLFPSVIYVKRIVFDEWGRRIVEAINEHDQPERLFTDIDLKPGQTYFMHSLTNPLRVFPILVPAGDLVWKP